MKRTLVFLTLILFFSSLAFSQNLEQKAKIGNVQAMHDLGKRILFRNRTITKQSQRFNLV